MTERLKAAKTLLVAANKDEAFVLVRALEGSLRFLGVSQHYIVSALAAAADVAFPKPPHPHAPDAPSAGVGDDGGNTVALIWQAVSVVGDWRKVVPALMSHGPHGILTALNVSSSRQRTACARGAKLRALQVSTVSEQERRRERPRE